MVFRIDNVTTEKCVQEQYGTDSNLQSHIRVKRLFSTGKQGWADFLLESFCLKSNQRILELGCGNAVFWKSASSKIPTGIKLTLSDFSPGMIESAKSNTSGLNFVDEYAVIDAQNLPYENNAFDIVIANYMLYHVPDTVKALREISRVLKPDGFFFAATFGKNNLKEVTDIFFNSDNKTDSVLNEMIGVFGLENGGELLGKHFEAVKLKKYENNLHITDFDSLLDYFLSYRGMGNISEIITDENIGQFSEYLNKIFSARGYVDITQEEGMFISSIPRK